MKPRVFIGSSREAMGWVDAIHDRLSYIAEVTPWHAGVFQGSDYPMEALERQLDSSDFAVFVLSPDDVVTMRGKTFFIPRDNTLFEMGLFWGKLRRERVYFLVPDAVPQRKGEDGRIAYHLASDLEGLTVLRYEANRSDVNLAAAVNRACSEIGARISRLQTFRDPRCELEQVQQELRLLRSFIHFFWDFNKGIISREQGHYDQLTDAVRNSYDPGCIGYKVKGAAIWGADSEEIRQLSGNVGRGRSYSLQANNELQPGEPRRVVVDAFLNSRIEFIQIEKAIVNEYLLCYPLSSSYVISIHIIGHAPVPEGGFELLFSENQELMGIIHHLFGGD